MRSGHMNSRTVRGCPARHAATKRKKQLFPPGSFTTDYCDRCFDILRLYKDILHSILHRSWHSDKRRDEKSRSL